jgi:hypothetical protein
MGRFLDLTNDQLRNSFDVNVIGVCNVSRFWSHLLLRLLSIV